MVLREQGGAKRAGRNAVDQQRTLSPQLVDVTCGGEAIVGALRDRSIVVAILGGAAVALHIDAPTVEAATREPIHRRGIGPAIDAEVECRLRGHRGAVDEKNRPRARFRIAGAFLEQKQFYSAVLGGPVLFALDRDRGGFRQLVHRSLPLTITEYMFPGRSAARCC